MSSLQPTINHHFATYNLSALANFNWIRENIYKDDSAPTYYKISVVCKKGQPKTVPPNRNRQWTLGSIILHCGTGSSPIPSCSTHTPLCSSSSFLAFPLFLGDKCQIQGVFKSRYFARKKLQILFKRWREVQESLLHDLCYSWPACLCFKYLDSMMFFFFKKS